MPRNPDIKKVLMIGSGPIVIGQAAEFDYAGTQACRSLKEEGIEVVLLNSNPATIMTDKDIADKVYIEPLTVEVVEHLPGAGGMALTRELIGGLKPGQSMAVLIGPEGGFSDEEIRLALEAGIRPVTLGKRILRTETAALFVLSAAGLLLES